MSHKCRGKNVFNGFCSELNYSLQVHQQKTVQDAHIAANNLILVRDAYQI